MIYKIMGDPIAQSRPRYATKNYVSRVYNSQKNKQLVASIDIMSQHGNKEKISGPVHMDITFFMPIPRSSPNHVKKNMPYLYHIIKPDLSNLIKFYEDICIGTVFHDDCIIASIKAIKIYDTVARTEFKFTKIEPKYEKT